MEGEYASGLLVSLPGDEDDREKFRIENISSLMHDRGLEFAGVLECSGVVRETHDSKVLLGDE